MAYCSINNTAIAVHTPSPPSDEDFEGWLDEIARCRAKTIIVVAGASPGPNTLQRKTMIARIKDAGLVPATAVLTSSAIARGVVTAVNWFNAYPVRGFATEDIAGAMKFLELNLSETEVRGLIERLRGELQAAAAASA